MSDPKGVVRTFFERVSAGNIDQAFELVSEDVRWWVPEELPFSGDKSKAEYMVVARSIQKGFPTGFKLLLNDAIVEGNKVAAEVESEGTHVNGKKYANKYHFLITVEGGKFVRVKEYMNTLHLALLIKP